MSTRKARWSPGRVYAVCLTMVVVGLLVVAAVLAPHWSTAGHIGAIAGLVGVGGVIVGAIIWADE